MNEKTAAEALAAYEFLYKNPNTGGLITDTDEAQVAADLAGVVRSRLDADRRIEHDRAVAERAWDEASEEFGYALQTPPDGMSQSDYRQGVIAALIERGNPYRKERENDDA